MSDRSFTHSNFHTLCEHLAANDQDLAGILVQYGYPPVWKRREGFDTLVHLILEQQVSLASARAAYDRLKEEAGSISPAKILALSDETLKACYFSRQKITYVRHLARAVVEKQLCLEHFAALSDEEAKEQLIAVKGIGQWTAEVYLMMALHRSDLFPFGDMALVNSLKGLKGLDGKTDCAALEMVVNRWRPYRTVAAFLLWHAYLCRKGIPVKPYD